MIWRGTECAQKISPTTLPSVACWAFDKRQDGSIFSCCLCPTTWTDLSYPPELKYILEWWTQIFIQGTNLQKQDFRTSLTRLSTQYTQYLLCIHLFWQHLSIKDGWSFWVGKMKSLTCDCKNITGAIKVNGVTHFRYWIKI